MLENFLASLKDHDSQVRQTAAEALGEMQDPRAVEPLIATLEKDEDSEVRATVAWALGQIGDIRAQAMLGQALLDANDRVCQEATVALQKISQARSAIVYIPCPSLVHERGWIQQGDVSIPAATP